MSEKRTAHVVWKGTGLEFHGTLGSGYEFDFSSPAGPEAGSPMEFLLAGVAGCTAMDVVSILRKMRQPVSGVEVEISGLRAGDYPMVYTDVDLVYVVHGAGVDARSVESAIELSEAKYCSASIMFRRAGVQVRSSYRIEEAALQTEAI